MVILMNEKQFSKDLVAWYQQNQRDLPWRHSKNPYHIWISEIMLQQTQVQTVIPYYQNFLEHFPTYQNLADASLEEIYKCWEGLGYYSRARNLKSAAMQIVDRGSFPNSYETLLELKGVGAYTAAAIASIAFENPVGVVDGNVLRILTRVYLLDDNIALEKTKKKLQLICNRLIMSEQPSMFNQGLMDLGATICKPRQPLCDKCPIVKHCLSYKHQKQNILPVNIKYIKHQEQHFISCIISFQNQYFLFKSEEGLLAHLYGLPQFDVESPHAFEEAFKKTYQEEIEIYDYLKDFKHVFTHRTWKMHVYLARFLEPPKLPLYTIEQIQDLPISTCHKKILNTL